MRRCCELSVFIVLGRLRGNYSSCCVGPTLLLSFTFTVFYTHCLFTYQYVLSEIVQIDEHIYSWLRLVHILKRLEIKGAFYTWRSVYWSQRITILLWWLHRIIYLIWFMNILGSLRRGWKMLLGREGRLDYLA